MSSLFSRVSGARSVVAGAALYVAMRWFDRAIGVISTIVLARLLTPEDFGIVALASIALGIAVVLLDVGIDVTVVQRRKIDPDELNTAWTLRLLQNVVISTVLALSSSWIADYYHDARLAPVLITLAFAYLINGFVGMGPVIFQKRQEYAREVTFFMAKRGIGFVVTVALAVWLRSYWALVIGSVVGSVIGVSLSYAMHREAPSLTLVRWRQFFGASSWLTLRAMGSYAMSQLDKLIVGRRDGATVLGTYSIADQVAAMPASELLAPTSRALFPAMSASQGDPVQLRRIFLLALGIQTSLALPASIGLALVAGELVSLLLGEKWAQAVPIMEALALAYGLNSLTSAGNHLLLSVGNFRSQALLQWGMATTFAVMLFFVFPLAGAEQIAWLRVTVGFVGVLAVAALVRRDVSVVTFPDMFGQIVRPALSTAVMWFAVLGVDASTAAIPTWLKLGLEVGVGALVYVVTLSGVWHLAGRPAGAEQWTLERARAWRQASGQHDK